MSIDPDLLSETTCRGGGGIIISWVKNSLKTNYLGISMTASWCTHWIYEVEIMYLIKTDCEYITWLRMTFCEGT